MYQIEIFVSSSSPSFLLLITIEDYIVILSPYIYTALVEPAIIVGSFQQNLFSMFRWPFAVCLEIN